MPEMALEIARGLSARVRSADRVSISEAEALDADRHPGAEEHRETP